MQIYPKMIYITVTAKNMEVQEMQNEYDGEFLEL